MQKAQQGFTLIELMIVVAIIGILASIAIPAYQTYIAKAKFSEVILASSGVKSAVEVCAQTSGTNVGCASDAGVSISATQGAGGTAVNTVGAAEAGEVVTITVTPNATKGILTTDTYIMEGTYASGAVTWALNSGSGCIATALCK